MNKIAYEVFKLVGNIALNGKAKVEKGLNQIDKTSEKVGKKFQQVGASVSSAGKTFTKFGTTAVIGLGTALYGLAQKTANAGDEIQKMSLRTGFSTETLSEFKHAAELSGTTINGLETGVKRMQRSVFDLERGLSTQTETFDELNLTIQDLQGLSPEQQFEKITMALAEVEDESKRAAIAQQIFGRSGTELLPMLAQGAEGIEEMRQEAHELGIVFDQEAADASAQFNDDLLRLQKGFTGIFQEVGMKLIPIFVDQLFPAIKNNVIPIVSDLVGLIGDATSWFGNLSPPLQKVILGAVALVGALGPVLMILGPIITSLGTIIPIIAKVTAAIAGISAPALATAAAIAGLVTAAVLVYKNWKEIKDALGAIWEYIKAQGENMSLGIQASFHKMKEVTLNTIDAMLEKLGVLEKLPFGIGDKFAGMKDAISDSADKSADKIDKLQKKAKENDKRIGKATENMGASFGDTGKAIANDVSGMIDTLNVFSTEAEASAKEQTDFAVDEYEYQTERYGENAEERTDKNEEEAKKRTIIINEAYKAMAEGRILTSKAVNNAIKKQTEFEEEQAKHSTEVNAYYMKKYHEGQIKNTGLTKEELEKRLKKENEISKYKNNTQKQMLESYRNGQLLVTELTEQQLEKQAQKAQEIADYRANVQKQMHEAMRQGQILNGQLTLQELQKQQLKEANALRNALMTRGQALQEYYNQNKEKNKNFWNTLVQNVKDAGITIAKISNQIANGIVDMLNSNYQAEKEYKNKRNEIKEDITGQIDDLQQKRQEELENVGNNIEEKEKINKKYDKLKADLQQNEKDRLNDTEEEYEESRKSIKDVLKEMLIDVINALEKQVIATQVAELAKAWAQSWWDWSAVARAAGTIAASTVALEGLKGLVRSFAEGGVVTDETFARIGEGSESEAVLPLNKQVYTQLAQGITQNMPQQQVVAGTTGQGDISVNFYDARLMSENEMDVFMDRAVRYIKDVGGLSNDQ